MSNKPKIAYAEVRAVVDLLRWVDECPARTGWVWRLRLSHAAREWLVREMEHRRFVWVPQRLTFVKIGYVI